MLTKIVDFIKSTAFLLGYLFAIATAYYLSYWTYFDIDVFQFISVEDIIKGIAYPLRFADVGIIAIFVFFVVLYTIIGLSKYDKSTLFFVVVILLTLSGLALWLLYFFKYADASPRAGLAITTLLTILLIVIYQISNDAYEKDKNDAIATGEPFADVHPAVSFRNIIVLFSLIFFPINAIIAGQVNARDIFDGKKYSYMLHKDFAKDKVEMRYDYLIFLGAISEKYIFINSNENERFIIDKSELPVLKIHHFDASSKESVNHLSENLFTQSQAATQKDTTKKK